MFPSPIIFKYGNNAQESNLEIVCTGGSVYVLNTDTNNLYGASMYGYMIGNSNTDTTWAGTSFRFMRSGIKKVFGNGGTTLCTYMLSTDNKVLALGNKRTHTGDAVNLYTPYEDITSTFTAVGIDPSTIVQVEGWYNSKTNILLSTGDLWCMGANSLTGRGCFGSGRTTASYNTPIYIMNGIKKATANTYLGFNGVLYSTGDNRKYQFGDGTTNSSWNTVQTDTDVTDMLPGYSSTFYIKSDKTMYCTGSAAAVGISNELGLGTGTNDYVAMIPKVCGTDIINIGTNVSNNATFQLKDTSSWYGTGTNDSGLLGTGDSTNKFIFSQMLGTYGSGSTIATNSRSTFVLNSNKLYVCGVKMGAGATSSSGASTNVLTLIDFKFQ